MQWAIGQNKGYKTCVRTIGKDSSHSPGAGLIDWVKLVEYISRRGKSEIEFPGVEKTVECKEYEALKKAQREKAKLEKSRKEEMKKKMKETS